MRKDGWRLVEVKTGREVNVGEVLTDFRGKTGDVLVDAYPPRAAPSEGKVEIEGGSIYYAGVYGLRWLLEPENV